MYASFTPDQMGLRTSAAFKHANDNFYVRGRKSNDKRVTFGPVTRKHADGTVKVQMGPATIHVTTKTTKLTAKVRKDWANKHVSRILALQAELYSTPR